MDDPRDVDPFSLIVPLNAPPPSVDSLAVNVIPLVGGGKLDIVPSTMDLMHVALGQPTGSVRPIANRFEKFISEARRKYDLIIIDCHPAGSIFTQTSLFNSDHVLIPVRPQPYAVRGLFLMLNFIKGRGARRAPVTPHVLFNYVPTRKVAPEEAQIRRVPELARYCLRNSLEYHSHFGKPSEGRNFVWRSKISGHIIASRNLRQVCTEFMARIA